MDHPDDCGCPPCEDRRACLGTVQLCHGLLNALIVELRSTLMPAWPADTPPALGLWAVTYQDGDHHTILGTYRSFPQAKACRAQAICTRGYPPDSVRVVYAPGSFIRGTSDQG